MAQALGCLLIPVITWALVYILILVGVIPTSSMDRELAKTEIRRER